MKIINLRIPEGMSTQLDSMCEIRGFKNRSEYIRDLISRDAVFRVGQASLDERLKQVGIEVSNTVERSRKEILQRIFVLTQVVLLTFRQPQGNRISDDQLKQFVDSMIHEAESKYPIN